MTRASPTHSCKGCGTSAGLRVRLSSSSIDGPKAGPTAYPTSRLNWSVSRLTSSLPVLPRSLWQPRTRRERFPSSWRQVVIRWGSGSSQASRPGGNVTGLSFSVGTDIVGKWLELLKETVPKVRRVAVLSNPANPSHALAIENVIVAARAVGVQLQLLEAGGPNEFDNAFAVMARDRAEALLVVLDPFFGFHRARLSHLAAKSRLPAMYGSREYPEVGGLMSYGADFRHNFRRSATYVDKILKGAKPADLPIEQPTKFELVINLKTAKVLGLTIPPLLLLRADQVIE